MDRMSLDDTPNPNLNCHGCSTLFKEAAPPNSGTTTTSAEGVSPLGRYRCPECHHDFCTDCDVFVHDVVHCCPGCGK